MSEGRFETLVMVEREKGAQIELRFVEREGQKAFVIFERSDGTECRIEIDPSQVRPIPQEAKYQYRGGVIQAPEQWVG